MIMCLLLLGGCAKGGEPGITPEEIQARLTADCCFTAAFTYENIEGCAEVEKDRRGVQHYIDGPRCCWGSALCWGRRAPNDPAIPSLTCKDHTIHEEALAAVMERVFAGADA